MNLAWRGRMLALLLAGAVVYPSAPFAQQAPVASSSANTSPATAGATAKSAPKGAVQKTDSAKRKSSDKSQTASGPKLDAAAAQGEVEAGINSLAQGKTDGAVTSLSAALSAGSLPSTQTARALYYRGVAYRRQGKPAQAISDLTSALWIKGGLSDDQRVDALHQRSGAYREAGLSDQAGPVASRSVAPAPITSKGKAAGVPAATAAVAPEAPSKPSSNTVGEFFSSLFGGASAGSTPQAVEVAASAPAAPRTPPSRVAEAQSLPFGFQEMATPMVPLRQSNPVPSQQETTASPAARSWSTATEVKQAGTRPVPKVQAVAVAAPKSAAPITTGSVQPAGKAAAAKSSAMPATPTVTPATPPPTKAQPTRGRATAALTQPTGNLQVVVAAVRSVKEAESVAERLQTQFTRELGGRAPVVDQTTVGSLGTLFRVQVGPFASMRDTDALCLRLKSEGMDCRVVTQ